MSDEWLRNLGIKIIQVTGFTEHGDAVEWDAVDDLTTLPEVCKQLCERQMWGYVVYPYMGRWCLYSHVCDPAKRIRYYDSKEAAEMIAIHNA